MKNSEKIGASPEVIIELTYGKKPEVIDITIGGAVFHTYLKSVVIPELEDGKAAKGGRRFFLEEISPENP